MGYLHHPTSQGSGVILEKGTERPEKPEVDEYKEIIFSRSNTYELIVSACTSMFMTDQTSAWREKGDMKSYPQSRSYWQMTIGVLLRMLPQDKFTMLQWKANTSESTGNTSRT